MGEWLSFRHRCPDRFLRTERGEERAPAALRAAGLVERLGARDAGDTGARIRDSHRDPDTGVIGAAEVRRASTAIASGVRELLSAGERPLPAVSYPQALRLDWDELVTLVRPLVAAPNLVGLSVADFNPAATPTAPTPRRVVRTDPWR